MRLGSVQAVMTRGAALVGLLTLAACGGGSVSGPVCSPFQPLAVGGSSVQSVITSDEGLEQAVIVTEAAPPVDVEVGDAIQDALEGPGRARKQILAISVGGQNGAFSSGFLTGWTETGTRPRFDIVTGASAGALVAPVAFAGSAFDAELRRNTGISDADIFERRGPLTALFSTSLFNTRPLERELRRFYAQDAFFDALTEQTAENRLLLIGATELNSGRFRRFDLARLLQSDESEATKRACMVEGVMASAAIPGLFPPRLINGDLYVDAGVRQSIFLAEIVEELDRARAPADVYLLINGALDFNDAEVSPSLLSLIERNFEIVTDEGMRASLLRVLSAARFNGWTLRAAAIPEMPDCDALAEEELSLFSSCVTEALFQQGYTLATSDDPWLNAEELEAALERGRVDP